MIDVHSDKYSFGFRKGRSAHQAIGELSRILQHKPENRRMKRVIEKRSYFAHNKFVLLTDVKGFFDNVDHDWLLENYPIPKIFKGILKQWLKSGISFQGKTKTNLTGFPQGSVIGPSLANYTLNNLEDSIKPSQVNLIDEDSYTHYQKIGKIVKKPKIRMSLNNRIVRFADDFVVICNHEAESKIVRSKLSKFLAERGLKVNETKSSCIKWAHGSKFNFLGFTFHYLIKTWPSRVTEQRDDKTMHTNRGGLYVYPSDISIANFKSKIKHTIQTNLNLSPYQLILLINPIIRG